MPPKNRDDFDLEPAEPEEPTPAKAPAPAAPGPLDALLEDWFVETFHNRGLGAAEHDHYRRQVNALKARLGALSRK